MKSLTKITYPLGSLAAIAVFMTVISFNTYSQNLIVENGQNESTTLSNSDLKSNVSQIERSSSGFWTLVDTKIETSNSQVTKWTGNERNSTGNSIWRDGLNIEHRIISTFKWDTPPSNLHPGTDLKLVSTYVNEDYSTSEKVKTGITIKIDKANENYFETSASVIEVVKLVKDNKQNNSEVKTGFISFPKDYSPDSDKIQVTVDCFIGNDHYLTVYIYNWVNN